MELNELKEDVEDLHEDQSIIMNAIIIFLTLNKFFSNQFKNN